jgi:recombination protein RecA
MTSASSLRAHLESSLGERLSSTLLLRERVAPLTVPIGLRPLDELTGGLPRGALSEIVGPSSSGRTGVMLAALAQATHRREICALVDASDSFDPVSAATAGMDLDRLLWVRCNERLSTIRRKGEAPDKARRSSGLRLQASDRFSSGERLEQVLKVADLLLQSGGFGMVVLDMGDISPASARRIPLTSWFRFRRAVEPTATVLLIVEQQPNATICASLVLRLERTTVCVRNSAAALTNPMDRQRELSQEPGNAVSHAAFLRGMGFRAEVVRSWRQRKPPQSIGTHFELRTAW